MKKPWQISILATMSLTGLMACWLGVFALSPHVACLLIGALILLSNTIMQRQLQMLFWLPLVVSVNWLVLSVSPMWVPPPAAISAGILGILSIIAIVVFTLNLCCEKLKHSRKLFDVLLCCVMSAGLASVYVTAMIVGAMLASSCLVWMLRTPHRLDDTPGLILMTIFSLPVLGVALGLAIGLGSYVIAYRKES